MGSLPTIIDDEALTLDPLDGVLGNIRPPFHSPTTPKTTPPFCRLSPSVPFPRLPSSKKAFGDDETPTTAAASLPTPRPPALTLMKPSYADVVRGYGDLDHMPWYSHHNDDDAAYLADPKKIDNMPSCPPDAPNMKDADSFTDGTYAGSFDFSLYSLDDVAPSYSQVDTKPTPQSIAFSPEEPLRSIENWREDVLTSTGVVPNDRCLEIDGDVDVESSPESPGQGDLGPRGIKRHLSWTSDAYRDHDGGPERARGRWEALKAPSSDSDALYSFAFYGDHAFDKQVYDHESDGLLYNSSIFEEDLGHVSDDVFISPPRPTSAPPYT